VRTATYRQSLAFTPFHVDLLKACNAEAAKGKAIAEVIPFSGDDDSDISVISILLAHRSPGRSRAYKIRWAGVRP
jgi:hypothetical protein